MTPSYVYCKDLKSSHSLREEEEKHLRAEDGVRVRLRPNEQGQLLRQRREG